MDVVVTRTGVTAAPRQVPTDTTASVLPMTFDRVGMEAPEDEQPTKISTLQDAFSAFKPALDFRTSVGDEGTEFVAELDFKSLKDFDPKQIRSRTPGKRNDIADLQTQIDLLHRMRESFSLLAVRRSWENQGQRQEIIEALGEFQNQLQLLANDGTQS